MKERRRREKRWEEDAHLYMDVQMCMCVGVCTLAAAFVLAWVHLHRGERIWQACLLSPQNNCLWITWGESHWRYLEMTLPGDSLNHVHIRSEREFDFALPDVCVSLYASRYVCVFVCACADPRGYVVSFILLTYTKVTPKTSQMFITRADCVYANTDFLHLHHLWLSSIPCSWHLLQRTFLVQTLSF